MAMAGTSENQDKKDVYVPDPSAVDISPEKDKGVLKEIVTPGVGDDVPKKGNKVKVHYTGKLTDGTKFDSSVDRMDPFEFTLGKGEVIKAWDIGVATMKKGERSVLVCAPEYAYGKAGSSPNIPPEATLIFEVELLSWEMEDVSPDSDKSILRSIIKEGEGFATPNDGATVEITLIGRCGGRVFEEKDVKFELGEGSEVGVVEGVELALQKFKKKEKSLVVTKPKYAYGSKGNEQLQIPPDAEVEYEITLKDFTKEKDSWNMDPEEKLERSESVKCKGTKYFQAEKYELAAKQYEKVISYLQYESDMEGEKKEKKDALLVAAYLNVALCLLKLKKYDDVVGKCEKALEIDPKNSKGYYRKGQVYLYLKDYEQAKESFLRVLELDPTNREAQKNITICKNNLKVQHEKEKKMYQAIFQKMSQNDEVDTTTAPVSNGAEPHVETDGAKS